MMLRCTDGRSITIVIKVRKGAGSFFRGGRGGAEKNVQVGGTHKMFTCIYVHVIFKLQQHGCQCCHLSSM